MDMEICDSLAFSITYLVFEKIVPGFTHHLLQ